jgi:autoinducer 2-degrading protein
MIVTCVLVSVLPDHVADFISACRDNHFASIAEAGNLRFDICQRADDPTSFLLYEAYASEAAAAAHKETGHYLTWRNKVAPWMASPRQGVRYDLLLPEAP